MSVKEKLLGSDHAYVTVSSLVSVNYFSWGGVWGGAGAVNNEVSIPVLIDLTTI